MTNKISVLDMFRDYGTTSATIICCDMEFVGRINAIGKSEQEVKETVRNIKERMHMLGFVSVTSTEKQRTSWKET